MTATHTLTPTYGDVGGQTDYVTHLEWRCISGSGEVYDSVDFPPPAPGATVKPKVDCTVTDYVAWWRAARVLDDAGYAAFRQKMEDAAAARDVPPMKTDPALVV
jgi:hypothetical protein